MVAELACDSISTVFRQYFERRTCASVLIQQRSQRLPKCPQSLAFKGRSWEPKSSDPRVPLGLVSEYFEVYTDW